MMNPYSRSATDAESLTRLENETLKAQMAALQFKMNQVHSNPDSPESRPGPMSRLATGPIYNSQVQQHQHAAAADQSSYSSYQNNNNNRSSSSSGFPAAEYTTSGGYSNSRYNNNNNNNNNNQNTSFNHHQHYSPSSELEHLRRQQTRDSIYSRIDTMQFQERNSRLILFLSESNERIEMLRRFSNCAVACVAFENERRVSLVRRVQERQGSDTEVERLRQSLIKMESELHEAANFANELHAQLQRSTQERSDLASENRKLTERITEALGLRSSEERLRIHEEEQNRNEIHELKARMVELKEDNDRLRRQDRQMVEELTEATQKIEEYSAQLEQHRAEACTQECKDAREHRDILIRDNAKMKEQIQQQEIKLRRVTEESVPLLIHKQEIAVLKSEVESRDRLIATIQQRNVNQAASEDLASRVQMQLEQERSVIVQLQQKMQEQKADHAGEILEWRNRESRLMIEKKSMEADLDAVYERLENSRHEYAKVSAALQASRPAQDDMERENVAAKLLVAAKEIEKLSNEKQALIDYINHATSNSSSSNNNGNTNSRAQQRR